MYKNKKLFISLSFGYVILILVTAVSIFYTEVLNNTVGMEIIDHNFLTYLGLFVLTIGLAIVKNIHVTLIYIIFIFSYFKFKKGKLSKDDFANETYYRDIIKNYSVAELGYIDDFKLGSEDLAASIMALELKKKIAINDKIEVIDDSNYNLRGNEIYLLKLIKDNCVKDINYEAFEELVVNDAINSKLLLSTDEEYIKEKTKLSKQMVSIFLLPLINIFFIFLIIFFAKNDTSIFIISMLLVLSDAVLVFYFFYRYTKYSIIQKLNSNSRYYRTKKAKEINKHLEGLKLFLKDFSTLDKKESKYLKLWEEYLIYSVIFNQNDKIIKEIESKLS